MATLMIFRVAVGLGLFVGNLDTDGTVAMTTATFSDWFVVL